VALGHLHRPQHIGSQRIQYAGSLLKYSLSEVGHRKSVTVVDIDGAGEVVVERVSLPLARDLRHLEGTLDELLAGAPGTDDLVYVTLLDKGPVFDAMARLRQLYPHAIHIEQPQFVPQGAMELPDAEHRRKSLSELFGTFFEQVQGEALSDGERSALDEVLASMTRLEDAS
jgi:exonuclease SbcD